MSTQDREESVTTVVKKVASVVTGMKYGGWSKYDFACMFQPIARKGKISENKAIQAVDFMRPKLAAMYGDDPVKLLVLIQNAYDEYFPNDPRKTHQQRFAELDEIQQLELRQTGRADTPRFRSTLQRPGT